jgi:hypothetical protein
MKPLSDEELMTRLREEDIPEPSPLFWEHLSQRIHDAVAAEPVPSRAWFSRFHVAWAGGIIAAAAMVVLAVTVSMRHAPGGPGFGPGSGEQTPVADVAAAGNSLPPLEDDASFAVMGELASEIDFDQAGAAGLTIAPGAVEDALNQMSDDEQRAVVELLRQEIKNSKSL